MSGTSNNADPLPKVVVSPVVDEKRKKSVGKKMKEIAKSLVKNEKGITVLMSYRKKIYSEEQKEDELFEYFSTTISESLGKFFSVVKKDVNEAIKTIRSAGERIENLLEMLGNIPQNASKQMNMFKKVADEMKVLAQLLEKEMEEADHFIWKDFNNDDGDDDDDEDSHNSEPNPKKFKANDGPSEWWQSAEELKKVGNRPHEDEDEGEDEEDQGIEEIEEEEDKGDEQSKNIEGQPKQKGEHQQLQVIGNGKGIEQLEENQITQNQPKVKENGKGIEQLEEYEVVPHPQEKIEVIEPEEHEELEPAETEQGGNDQMLVDQPQSSNDGQEFGYDDQPWSVCFVTELKIKYRTRSHRSSYYTQTGNKVPFVPIRELDLDPVPVNEDSRIMLGEEGTKQQAKDGDSEGGSIEEENIPEIQDVENLNGNEISALQAPSEIPKTNEDKEQDQEQKKDRSPSQQAIQNGTNEESAVDDLPNAEGVVHQDEQLEEPDAIEEHNADQSVVARPTGNLNKKATGKSGKRKRGGNKFVTSRKSKKTEVDASQPPRFRLPKPSEEEKRRDALEEEEIERTCPPETPLEDKFTSYRIHGPNFNKFLEDNHDRLYTQSVEGHVEMCANGSEFFLKKNLFQGTRAYKIMSIDGWNFNIPDDDLETVGKKFNQKEMRYFINGKEEPVTATLRNMFDQMKRRKEKQSYDRLNLVSHEVSFDKMLDNYIRLQFNLNSLQEIVRSTGICEKESVLYQVKEKISKNLDGWRKEKRRKITQQQKQDANEKINAWKNRKDQMAAVEQFIIMSVGGAFMSLHCDMGGTWVYYHVKQGRKVFFIALGTPENLEIYTDWMAARRPQSWILKELKSELRRVEVRAGESVVLPAGCLHLVYTPEDSLVYAGNYLTTDLQSMEISFKMRNFEGYCLRRRIIGLGSMMAHYWDSWFFYGENLVTKERNDENARIAAVIVKNLKDRVRTVEGDFYTGQEKGEILNSMIQAFDLNENLLAIEEITTAPEPQKPVNEEFDENDVYHTDGSEFEDDEEDEPVGPDVPDDTAAGEIEDEMDD
ncbi:Protein CBG01999 [Caenorhabditis briggsae]|uniref:Protein CBG01999 n=1 Tax=Caenorhabditis briggsae TaxID=6238 RepID=A8WRR9_CAEBR|nr:Protein CBG01999 [Caenorhabditis briggsae]CAP23177.2 Protein CBG01999 [Caenorhabditis briggsae]